MTLQEVNKPNQILEAFLCVCSLTGRAKDQCFAHVSVLRRPVASQKNPSEVHRPLCLLPRGIQGKALLAKPSQHQRRWSLDTHLRRNTFPGLKHIHSDNTMQNKSILIEEMKGFWPWSFSYWKRKKNQCRVTLKGLSLWCEPFFLVGFCIFSFQVYAVCTSVKEPCTRIPRMTGEEKEYEVIERGQCFGDRL